MKAIFRVVLHLLRILVGARGYTIVARRELDYAARDHLLRSLFRALGPDLVLDVGANTGQFRKIVRERVGYTGPAISFEPVPEFADSLREQISGDDQWELVEVALGASDSVAALSVMGEFSSIRKKTAEHTRIYAGIREEREIEVPVARLDQVVEDPGERIFLKIDTQGFELDVLRGAEEILHRVAIIQCELSFTALYEDQPGAEETLHFLQERGFRPAGVYRINDAGYPHQMLEGDGFFVHETYCE